MTPPDDYFSDLEFQILERSFHDFVAQGEGRSVAWLARKTGLSLQTVARGYTQGRWTQRIAAIGKDAALVVQAKLIGDVAGMNEHDLSRLVMLEDASFDSLLKAVQSDIVKPDTLVRIVFAAQQRRRLILGLGEGAPPTNPLAKLLEGSLAGESTASFVLDPKKLEAPPDLPSMPGMTSDAFEDPKRELDADEKDALRP